MRSLLMTEVVFASDVVGSGMEWTITTGLTDQETIATLRGLQRKLLNAGQCDVGQLAHSGANPVLGGVLGSDLAILRWSPAHPSGESSWPSSAISAWRVRQWELRLRFGVLSHQFMRGVAGGESPRGHPSEPRRCRPPQCCSPRILST